MATIEGTIESKIPARMDRLPWTRWRWYIRKQALRRLEAAGRGGGRGAGR